MNKTEFLYYLRKKLKHFKTDEIESVISYYDELITEKIIEEKIDEQTAVDSLGKPEYVAEICASEMLSQKKQQNPIKALLIVGGVLASPLLLPIALTAGILYLVAFILWLSFFISFGVIGFTVLIACIPACFSGYDFATTLIVLGVLLLICSLMLLLCYLVYVYGGKILISLTSRLGKLILKKHNK